MNQKKVLLRELLKQKKIVAPCVFDSASARAAELSGYEAMVLSGAELCMATKGYPDLGVLNLNELIEATTQITNNSPLPLIVDMEDGFGTAINVYETCSRLAKAGAQMLIMEDEIGPAFIKGVNADDILSDEAYFAKVKAALAALKGTDCMFCARTNIETSTHLDRAIERCQKAVELGAEATMIVRVNNLEDATEIAKRVGGIKIFPDINQDLDAPKLTFKDVLDTGFQIVTVHFMMKAAMTAMIEWGVKNLKEGNNFYSNDNAVYGAPGQSGQPFFQPQRWLDLEAEFTGKRALYKGFTVKVDKDK